MVVRRTVIRKPRKTTVRSVKFADQKHIGQEPVDGVVIEDSSDSVYARALAWYNYYYEIDDAKKWLLEYMKQDGYSNDVIRLVKTAPTWKTSPTSGFMAKLLMKGWTLPEKSMTFLRNMIGENALYGKGETPTEKQAPDLQARIRAKAIETRDKVEDHIDQWFWDYPNSKFNIYDFLQGESPSPIAIGLITEYLNRVKDDLDFDKTNKDATAANRARAKKCSAAIEGMLEDIDRYTLNKKATKKPRKTRVAKSKPASKVVEKLNYMKQFPELKIVSINPTEVVGCQNLWTYNTKSRKLTHYTALGPNGITVSRSTLTGFDVERSVSKRLRKPEQSINDLLNAGKVQLKKFMDTINTNGSQPTGRINNDTILLKVTK